MKKFLIILIVLLLALSSVGLYYSIARENDNKVPNDNNNQVENDNQNNNDNQTENNNQNDNVSIDVIDESYKSKEVYKLYYKKVNKVIEEDETEIDYELILYTDNIYLLSVTAHAGNLSQGTYKIDGNKLYLSEKISYDSDCCFYKNMTNEYVLDINSDGTVTHNDEGFGSENLNEINDGTLLDTINNYLNNTEISDDGLCDCTEDY